MPNYHLYYVKSAHAMGLDVLNADNDVQAVEDTSRYRGTGDTELRCGDRMIRHFERGLGRASSISLPDPSCCISGNPS